MLTAEKGHCIGTVRDAVTGLPIAAATVWFTLGSRPIAKAKSAKNGRYYAALPNGNFKLRATKTGYYPAFRSFKMTGLGVHRRDLVLSPKLRPYQTRFILTWEKPDTTLEAYMKVSGTCTLSGYQKHCRSPLGGKSQFDQEKCAGHGPITMTVTKWAPGKYWYFVMQTGYHGTLARSNAVVRVITGDGKSRAFRVGKYGKLVGKTGKGRAWCVFSVDGKKALKGGKGFPGAISDCSGVEKYLVQKQARHILQGVQTSKALRAQAILGKRTAVVTRVRRPMGALSGKIINAVNGRPVKNAKVTAVGADGRAVKVARTKSNGMYFLSLPYGRYRMVITHRSFFKGKDSVSIVRKATSKRIVVSPTFSGAIRLVLTWSSRPKDMDSYLRTPSGCTIWYKKRHCHHGGGKADLDVDNTRGKGPETITVHKAASGWYYYYIQQYSTRGSLRSSKSVVRIYLPDGSVSVHKVGRYGQLTGRPGRGRTWMVARFRLKGRVTKSEGKAAWFRKATSGVRSRGFRRRGSRRRRFRI